MKGGMKRSRSEGCAVTSIAPSSGPVNRVGASRLLSRMVTLVFFDLPGQFPTPSAVVGWSIGGQSRTRRCMLCLSLPLPAQIRPCPVQNKTSNAGRRRRSGCLDPTRRWRKSMARLELAVAYLQLLCNFQPC